MIEQMLQQTIAGTFEYGDLYAASDGAIRNQFENAVAEHLYATIRKQPLAQAASTATVTGAVWPGRSRLSQDDHNELAGFIDEITATDAILYGTGTGPKAFDAVVEARIASALVGRLRQNPDNTDSAVFRYHLEPGSVRRPIITNAVDRLRTAVDNGQRTVLPVPEARTPGQEMRQQWLKTLRSGAELTPLEATALVDVAAKVTASPEIQAAAGADDERAFTELFNRRMAVGTRGHSDPQVRYAARSRLDPDTRKAFLAQTSRDVYRTINQSGDPDPAATTSSPAVATATPAPVEQPSATPPPDAATPGNNTPEAMRQRAWRAFGKVMTPHLAAIPEADRDRLLAELQQIATDAVDAASLARLEHRPTKIDADATDKNLGKWLRRQHSRGMSPLRKFITKTGNDQAVVDVWTPRLEEFTARCRPLLPERYRYHTRRSSYLYDIADQYLTDQSFAAELDTYVIPLIHHHISTHRSHRVSTQITEALEAKLESTNGWPQQWGKPESVPFRAVEAAFVAVTAEAQHRRRTTQDPAAPTPRQAAAPPPVQNAPTLFDTAPQAVDEPAPPQETAAAPAVEVSPPQAPAATAASEPQRRGDQPQDTTEPATVSQTSGAQAPVVDDAEPTETGSQLQVEYTRQGGVLVHGTVRGDGANHVLKAHRLWFSGRIGTDGAWYIRRSRGAPADVPRIRRIAAALETAGFTVSTTIEGIDTPKAAAVPSPQAATPTPSEVLLERNASGVWIKGIPKATPLDSSGPLAGDGFGWKWHETSQAHLAAHSRTRPRLRDMHTTVQQLTTAGYQVRIRIDDTDISAAHLARAAELAQADQALTWDMPTGADGAQAMLWALVEQSDQQQSDEVVTYLTNKHQVPFDDIAAWRSLSGYLLSTLTSPQLRQVAAQTIDQPTFANRQHFTDQLRFHLVAAIRHVETTSGASQAWRFADSGEFADRFMRAVAIETRDLLTGNNPLLMAVADPRIRAAIAAAAAPPKPQPPMPYATGPAPIDPVAFAQVTTDPAATAPLRRYTLDLPNDLKAAHTVWERHLETLRNDAAPTRMRQTVAALIDDPDLQAAARGDMKTFLEAFPAALHRDWASEAVNRREWQGVDAQNWHSFLQQYLGDKDFHTRTTTVAARTVYETIRWNTHTDEPAPTPTVSQFLGPEPDKVSVAAGASAAFPAATGTKAAPTPQTPVRPKPQQPPPTAAAPAVPQAIEDGALFNIDPEVIPRAEKTARMSRARRDRAAPAATPMLAGLDDLAFAQPHRRDEAATPEPPQR